MSKSRTKRDAITKRKIDRARNDMLLLDMRTRYCPVSLVKITRRARGTNSGGEPEFIVEYAGSGGEPEFIVEYAGSRKTLRGFRRTA